LLDIGSGIGAFALGMLKAGVKRALCVDISEAAIAASAEEAERQGMTGRIEWVEGDFVAVAAIVPLADLVALDRVVCCYPAYAPLLEQAAAHSRRLLALSYPRDRWWIRLGLRIENTWRWLRGDRFRAFLHPPGAMAALLARQGFTRVRGAATWTWQVEVYVRNAT
jgi:magnesium-protoporphyrin O-methyltransferase